VPIFPGARLLLVFACLAVLHSGVRAQTEPPPESTFSDRWQAAPAQRPQKRVEDASRQKSVIGLPQALYLIRSTLLTLNDANRSGNYTVLRDLAAPGFRDKNSPADLARIFTDLRDRHFDLFSAALIAPELSAPPHEEAGLLRLTGTFPTRPLQIRFDLLFQKIENQWRLFGISVQTPNAPPLAARNTPGKKQ
jgi:hypothetical protein